MIYIFDDIKASHGSLLHYFATVSSLNLSGNPIITDNVMFSLTNLASLDLGYNKIITDKSVMCLENLNSLDLYHNYIISSIIKDKFIKNIVK